MKLNPSNEGENMDGYFKPKLKDRLKELRLLELEEIEHMSEDDELDFSLTDPLEKSHYHLRKFHRCPRCKTVTQLETHDPYCPECNWDSLTDVSSETNKCVA
jgi:phage FluMu protein Com